MGDPGETGDAGMKGAPVCMTHHHSLLFFRFFRLFFLQIFPQFYIIHLQHTIL